VEDSTGSPSFEPQISHTSEEPWSIPMTIISTMVRWWWGSRVAAGVRVHTFDEILELPTEEPEAIDLVRMDDDGWQLSPAPSIPRQIE
jgi:hypothetical protein